MVRLGPGDKVIIADLSNASLNLWMKAKMNGGSFLKCPCNAKNTELEILSVYQKVGFICKFGDHKTIVHRKDVRGI